MTFTFQPGPTFGPYLPEEFQLPDDPDAYREFIAERERITASIVNDKDSGNYELIEIPTSQDWFVVGNNNVKRPGFRKAFNRPAGIVAGGVDAFAHGITNLAQPTRIWGVATTAAGWEPLPYVSLVLANQVQVDVTAANIVVSNGAIAITSYIIMIEYLKT